MDEKKTKDKKPKKVRAADVQTDLFVQQALADLREYSAGKASIDAKATENQEWWRLRHWNVLAEQNEGKKVNIDAGSAWAINSLLNRHADIMDSFPKPNILPREPDDEIEAKLLSSVVPVVLEQNDYEARYRQKGWDFIIDGGAITGIFWDSTKRDGMGDISISNVDVHNLAWKPGVNNIQDSPKLYYTSLEDIESVRMRFPKIADKIGPQDTGIVTKYLHDDNIDYTQVAEVINMYYKKTVMVPVEMDGMDAEGNPTKVLIHTVPKTVLHLAIIVNDQLAFCSENEPGYENGFYEHGKYPFVISRLFPVKDSPWGFGYLDIMKHPQRDIDKLDQAIIKNAMMKARPRYWARKNANIDVNAFADWNNEIVEVATGELGDSIRKIDVDDVPSGAMNHLMNKIDELKETSGNRDFNQGGTSAGVTAAASIAALQEAGSKLSRDVNKELYRAAREEFYLVIELMRQFYTEPRPFRVENGQGGYEFMMFSNAGIVDSDTPMPDGTIRHKKPIFDILVTAEKQSPFSRAAQNETIKELYGMGLFQPENALPALVCLDAMDFEGKDKLKQQVQQNATILQQFESAMQLIQNQAMIDPAFGQMAMQAGVIDPEQMMAMQQAQAQTQGPQRSGSGGDGSSGKGLSYADKIRKRSAEAANPSAGE